MIQNFGALWICPSGPDYTHLKRPDQFIVFIDVSPHAKNKFLN